MKKAIFFLAAFLIASMCLSFTDISAQGEKPSRAEKRKLRKISEMAQVKKAVESRRYVIKVRRLYTNGGGFYEMVPTANFVIINGEFASISLGYVGRSFGIHPITGINLNGRTYSYKMQDRTKGQGYDVQLAVKYGGDKFDVYLTIGPSGSCGITINNPYIQSIRYEGDLEPIPASQATPPTDRLERM